MQPSPAYIDVSAVPVDLILWLGCIMATVVFCIFSVLMLWHWKEFSTGKFTTVANMLVYIGVGGGLLVVMVLATVWYGVS